MNKRQIAHVRTEYGVESFVKLWNLQSCSTLSAAMYSPQKLWDVRMHQEWHRIRILLRNMEDITNKMASMARASANRRTGRARLSRQESTGQGLPQRIRPGHQQILAGREKNISTVGGTWSSCAATPSSTLTFPTRYL